MQTTLEFLEAIKSLNNQCSDYRIAKILGVKPQAVSSWRLRGSIFDDETALRVAEALGLPPEYVIACIHAERAKSDNQRAAWASIASKFHYAAASVLVVVGALLGAPFLSS